MWSRFQLELDTCMLGVGNHVCLFVTILSRLPLPTHTHTHTHMHRVVEYGHVNKMQATNLAIVFGPTLMRSEHDSLEMATLMPVQNGIVEVMISEFNSIFRK